MNSCYKQCLRFILIKSNSVVHPWILQAAVRNTSPVQRHNPGYATEQDQHRWRWAFADPRNRNDIPNNKNVSFFIILFFSC